MPSSLIFGRGRGVAARAVLIIKVLVSVSLTTLSLRLSYGIHVWLEVHDRHVQLVRVTLK